MAGLEVGVILAFCFGPSNFWYNFSEWLLNVIDIFFDSFLENRGKFTVLEDTSCRIKPGCTEHPPWPGGICTKCQPSAITLKRQVSCLKTRKTAHE